MTTNPFNELLCRELRKRAVWNKGMVIPNWDPAVWRWDAYGRVIKYDCYGDRSSNFGWEMDHHPIPQALGGADNVLNLRPLNCFANASLGGMLGNALRG